MNNNLTYIINHLGEKHEDYFNAVAPPIIQSSNFCFKTFKELQNAVDNEFEIPAYTRGNNPTVEILRKKIAAIEGAEDALIFSSGSAAIASAVITNLKAGDHVICVKKPYGWTQKLFSNLLQRFNVEVTYVDGTDIANFQVAIRNNTKLIYLESPNSFTFELQDLKAVAKLARQHNIVTVIDNSYSTALYQKPIEMGIDIVVYSGSKYYSGHSDVIAGMVCTNQAMIRKIFAQEFMTIGSIISPHDAWLILRGLRTLELRLERSAQSAQTIIKTLAQHPKIEKIIYPFHSSHPQYNLALQQMKNANGLFSIQVKAKNVDDIERFCNSLNYFLLACSWGGHESLVYPAAIACSNGCDTQQMTVPWNLVRFYVGLEDPEILLSDILAALETLS